MSASSTLGEAFLELGSYIGKDNTDSYLDKDIDTKKRHKDYSRNNMVFELTFYM